jgi:hypothetical protein
MDYLDKPIMTRGASSYWLLDVGSGIGGVLGGLRHIPEVE